MKFSEILPALKAGHPVRRTSWHSPGRFIVRQLPQTVPADVVPKMTSLPEHVKAIIGTVGLENEHKGCITYHDQVLIIVSDDYHDTTATSYVPTWEDLFAEDWATA